MIKKDPEMPNNFLNTAIIGENLAAQVWDMYDEDPVIGGELAMAAIAFIMTGGMIVSDNRSINRILRGSLAFVEKNAQSAAVADEKREQKKIKEMQLDAIANYLNEGRTQIEISKILNIKTSTLSDRVKKIRTQFPYLLKFNSNPALQEENT